MQINCVSLDNEASSSVPFETEQNLDRKYLELENNYPGAFSSINYNIWSSTADDYLNRFKNDDVIASNSSSKSNVIKYVTNKKIIRRFSFLGNDEDDDDEHYKFDKTVGSNRGRVLIKNNENVNNDLIRLNNSSDKYIKWIEENEELLIEILFNNDNPMKVITSMILKNEILLQTACLEYKNWNEFRNFRDELEFFKSIFQYIAKFLKGTQSFLIN